LKRGGGGEHLSADLKTAIAGGTVGDQGRRGGQSGRPPIQEGKKPRKGELGRSSIRCKNGKKQKEVRKKKRGSELEEPWALFSGLR